MSATAALAAGITAGANVSGGIISGNLNQKRTQENMRLAYSLHNRNLALAPSYELQGYKNAGINPFVEGAGDFQSNPSVTADAAPINFGTLGTDMINAYNQFQSTKADVNLKRSEEESNYVKSAEGRANIELIKSRTHCSDLEAENIAIEWYKIQSEIDVNLEMRSKIFADTALSWSQKNKTESDQRVNESTIGLQNVQKEYQELMKKSLDKYINETLPRQWKLMDKQADVEETKKLLNRINYAQIAQQVTMNEMDIMQASEALADNIKAAGIEAQRRLVRATMGLTSDDAIDKVVKEKTIPLRIATRLIGTLSKDMATDIIGNAQSAASSGISAGAAVVGAAL